MDRRHTGQRCETEVTLIVAVAAAAAVSAAVLLCCLLGDMKGIRPVKTLHQNPTAMVVDIYGWDTGYNT